VDIRALAEFFRVRTKAFTAAQDAHAREFERAQVGRWRDILRFMASQIPNTVKSEQNLRASITNIGNLIELNSHQLFRIQRLQDGWVVSGLIPLIEQYDLTTALSETEFYDLLAAVSVEVLPVFSRGIFVNNINSDAFDFLNHPQVQSIATIYAASVVQAPNRKALEASLEKTTAAHRSFLDQFVRNAQDALNDVQSATQQTHDLEARLNKEMIEFISNEQQKFEELASITKQETEAFLNAQSQFRMIKQPVELWATSASRHRKRYYIGLLVLSLSVPFLGAIGISMVPNFLAAFGLISLPYMPQPFTPRSAAALTLLIALIAATGWLLRIAGRFVTNSLTLAEDAEMRAALADAFLGFTAKEALDDKDRTIMLAALFRPLPGHQQEDIEPPTVLSLAREAIKPKGA
jgi:hypothetical protein